MALSDYSSTAADNTSISGITVTDATVANQLDNILRQMMADLASAIGTVEVSGFSTGDGTTTTEVTINGLGSGYSTLTFEAEGVDRWAITREATTQDLNVNNYDASGVYNAQASFSTYGSGVSLALAGVTANDRYYGSGTNNAALIQNDQSGEYVYFGDVGYFDTVTGTPNRLWWYDGSRGSSWGINADVVSDRRVKSGILPSGVDALSDILALQFVQHDYSAGPSSGSHVDIALVAQDVQAIAPEAVQVAPDKIDGAPDDGMPENYLSIWDYPLLMRALRAIQQQQSQIDALTARVAALEQS